MTKKNKTDEIITRNERAELKEHAARKKINLDSNPVYLNRELSLLAFNRRVLAQAELRHIPLLERLRYLCIASSNLDEFFEVRIASLLANSHKEGITDDTPALTEALRLTSIECHKIVDQQYAILNKEVLPQLSSNGVHLLRHTERNEAQRGATRLGKVFF